MSIFKNTLTGDVTTVFGPLHDNYVLRSDEELVLDDRDAAGKPSENTEVTTPPSSSGKKPEIGQETNTTDVADVGNPKE